MSHKMVAEVVVETLQSAGVRHCWGVPGDTLNYVTDAIRRSKIEWVHVRHEEVAGFAAGAEALLSGNLTACAGSCGPGSLHFINGLFESHRNRAPVVLIASQVINDERGFDFPQEVDFTSVYQTCSVFCSEIRSPEQARRKTAMAAQAALSKRGLAVLILPVDVSKLEISDDPAFAVHRATPVLRPSDAELDRIAQILNAGTKIAIYGGSGCDGAHDEIIALAGRLKAPIAHTSRAKDFIEYDNPFNVGMTGVIGMASGYGTLIGCDTLLLLGCDFAWRQFYPEKARIVQVDIEPTHLGRRHSVELGVVGDVKATVAALLPRISERADRRFLDDCLAQHKRAVETLGERATINRGGRIHPQYLASLIDQHADANAIFTADGGSPMVWLLRHVKANGARRTLLSLTHGTMANAMPQALGAKKAFPGRQVISFSGDGGLSMLMGDLLTAVQERIPIKVAVFNNGSLGFVELEMKAEGLLDAYTNLENPDFARVAEAIGFHARRVERAEDLDGAVRDWLAQTGPALLDVVTSRMELVMPPHIEAGPLFGMALYSAKAVLAGRAGDVWELVTENL
ncbi:MAG: ubiquinone-dependent pyruvate dehydrogenase [Acetobacteraceae bacterium]|nr:ubiquinone-dependent pyruvate dehydrogenase [Acetobacteraceae bacterium]